VAVAVEAAAAAEEEAAAAEEVVGQLHRGQRRQRRERSRTSGVGDLLVVRPAHQGYEPDENLVHREHLAVRVEEADRCPNPIDRAHDNRGDRDHQRDFVRSPVDRHFDLKREVDTSIKEDLSVKAGLSISAKYGTVVEVHSNLDVVFEQTKEQTTKQASDFSKDVTTRAAEKVTQRTLQSQTTHTVDSFQTTDEHGFDNTQGTGNVIGIYQWLNKVYEAQVFSYGKRTMFDVMVPEPAAFLIDAVSRTSRPSTRWYHRLHSRCSRTTSTRPNYFQYVRMWNATGVTPPLADFVTGRARGGGDQRPRRSERHQQSLSRHEAAFGICGERRHRGDRRDAEDAHRSQPRVSDRCRWRRTSHCRGNPDLQRRIGPNSEIDIFPVTIQTRHAYDVTISVEVICVPSQNSIDEGG